MGVFDLLKRKKSQHNSLDYEAARREILRHYELMKECEDLVNKSPNFSTVLKRFDLFLGELAYFAAFDVYGTDYLEKYGIKFKTTATDLWQRTIESQATILNGAIDRLLDVEIDRALELKTKLGQENRMNAFIREIQETDGVPFETLKYISTLPVLDALREPKVRVVCRCGCSFVDRPHAYKGFFVTCPECRQQLRVDTSKR